MEPTDGTLRIGRSPDGQRFGRFLIGPTVLVLNACKSPQEVEEVLRKIGLYPSRVEVED
jgi:hypothetical protein